MTRDFAVRGRGLGAALSCVVVLLSGATPGAAQTAECVAIPIVDSLYFAGNPSRAWELLSGPGGCAHERSEWRWRAMRALTAIGEVASTRPEHNALFDLAVELADEIRTPGPPTLDEVYWSGMVHGNRALWATAREAARHGSRAQDELRLVLRVDSLHAGAHHGLGRIAYEVMTLSLAERLLGRLLLGSDFPDDVGWDVAEEHLSRAVELDPTAIIYQFDLARMLVERERWDEAVAALHVAIDLPPRHPSDGATRTKARTLLEQIVPGANAPDG